MEVKFETAQGLSEEQLIQVENVFGVTLPLDIRHFLQEHAGATPKLNNRLPCFNIKHPNGWNQECFVEKVNSFEHLIQGFEYRSYLEEYVEHFGLSTDYVEVKHLLSVAELPIGEVLVALAGQHTGKVYTADSGDFGILYHSNSLQEFWSSVHGG